MIQRLMQIISRIILFQFVISINYILMIKYNIIYWFDKIVGFFEFELSIIKSSNRIWFIQRWNDINFQKLKKQLYVVILHKIESIWVDEFFNLLFDFVVNKLWIVSHYDFNKFLGLKKNRNKSNVVHCIFVKRIN